MSKYTIIPADGAWEIRSGEGTALDPFFYYAGYDFMGSTTWYMDPSRATMLQEEEARQIVTDLEAADAAPVPVPAPAPVPVRECAGYRIIVAVPTAPHEELVIGYHPSAPSPYVCWYCLRGNDYCIGHYCHSFRAAMTNLADRIGRADTIPLNYWKED